jgi:NAD+ synthetase
MSNNFLTLQYGKVAQNITRFISSQVKLRKKNGVVIGLSGGIDSSVCLILACRSLTDNIIIGLSMPEKNVTPRKDLYNVRSMAKTLNIRYKEIDIERGKKYSLNNPVKDKLAGEIFQQELGWRYSIITRQLIIYWY